MFAGSWTDSWQQDATPGTMGLLVPSDQRPIAHHTLERRTCYQNDHHRTRSDSNRYSVTSDISQTSRSYKRRENVEHHEQHKSASAHKLQQTRSRSPRPHTYVARANGRLRRSSHHGIDSQEHHVRRDCVKHQDGAACRCNSNARITRAGESSDG
jgi:hypothetical protein